MILGDFPFCLGEINPFGISNGAEISPTFPCFCWDKAGKSLIGKAERKWFGLGETSRKGRARTGSVLIRVRGIRKVIDGDGQTAG